MPLAALALLVAGTLGACGSEEPPVASPSPTASTTASPSPSATPTPSASASSDIPAAAREKSEKGAEAFVRFFVKQSALAWTTPEPALIRNLSDPDCDSCAELARTAAALKKQGHRYEREPISVKSTEVLTGDGRRQNVAASIDQRAVNVVDARGNLVSSDSAQELERTFLLYWKGDRWVVGGIA
jgi:hypothetical protein